MTPPSTLKTFSQMKRCYYLTPFYPLSLEIGTLSIIIRADCVAADVRTVVYVCPSCCLTVSVLKSIDI